MKVILIALSIFLFSCESSTAVKSASTKGIAALSCSEIYNLFSAFERDKATVQAAKALGLGIDIPYTEGTDPSSYISLAKTAANVALLAQGCGAL